MMEVVAFTFNAFAENTYLLIDERKQVLIIDPGMSNAAEQSRMAQYLAERELQPLKIYNTHAHLDHIYGVAFLKRKYRLLFGLHSLEQAVLESGIFSAQMYGLSIPELPAIDFFIKEDSSFSFDGKQFEVLFTPGHSPGSVSFYCEEDGFVLSGDVLFQDGIGRTDLPGGNAAQLLASINEKLYQLPDETVVYPGHGPATTIGREKNMGYLAG